MSGPRGLGHGPPRGVAHGNPTGSGSGPRGEVSRGPRTPPGYVLRKGFGHASAELASLLRITAPNARVVVHRAQAWLESGRERPVPVESHHRLAVVFRTAAHTGDVGGLVKVLAPPRDESPTVSHCSMYNR